MDLLLGENNDLVFVNGSTPVTDENRITVAQRLSIRLKTFLGEWFISTSYGVPYFQQILGKKTTKDAVDRIFQQQILSERGVLEITDFSSTLSPNRQYEMQFRVRTNLNEITETINITVGV